MPGNRLRFFAGLLTALALVLATAAPTYAQQPTPKPATGPVRDAGTGIVFPMSLAGLELVFTVDFEAAQRGLGVSYRYRDPGDPFNLDLYIYNKGQNIPSGVTAAIVNQEVDAALADVRTLAARGQYQNLSITDTSSTCRYGDLQFRCVTLRFETSRGPVQSLLLLRGDRGNFIKIRATWLSEDVKAAAAVQRWVTALAGLLKP